MNPNNTNGLEIMPVKDHSIFHHTPHPYLGRISTPIRRFELGVRAHLASQRPRRAWEFAATRAGVPIGVATVCLGPHVAGVFDVGVLPEHRGRGVGTALVQHLCEFAQEHGMIGLALIATGMGERVYRRVGFEEVCRMSYWYSSLGIRPLRGTSKLPP